MCTASACRACSKLRYRRGPFEVRDRLSVLMIGANKLAQKYTDSKIF